MGMMFRHHTGGKARHTGPARPGGMRSHVVSATHPGQARPGAPSVQPGADGVASPGAQQPGATGQESQVQNMLGQQASMQRVASLQKQMGVPTTPQGQF